MKTTVRNLRIREDTAKYLLNLDVNSAFYDPKTRSMRENPLPGNEDAAAVGVTIAMTFLPKGLAEGKREGAVARMRFIMMATCKLMTGIIAGQVMKPNILAKLRRVTMKSASGLP